MIRSKVDNVDSFTWQPQLKHKFRLSPKHARYKGRDPQLRCEGGGQAEVAICDAILPYDYEYLEKVLGLSLLLSRIGCAPTGPFKSVCDNIAAEMLRVSASRVTKSI